MSKKHCVKLSKKAYCSITLENLESSRSKFSYVDNNFIIDSEVFTQLVLYSPSKQSNLGVKISPKLQKHIDELVNDIVEGIGVKNTYFFSSYRTKKADSVDLSQEVLNDNNTYLFLYCSNTFSESLFVSIRNALAHGNVLRKGEFIYFYALSSKDGNNIPEKKRDLSFLLKVYDAKKLYSYIDAFNKFN